MENEKEYFRQLALGDEVAFEQIFHAFNARLFPFICSITKSEAAAEEIVQEVFLKLWLHRESLATVNEPAAWLIRVASNLSLNWLRKQAVHVRAVKILMEKQSANLPIIEDEMDLKNLKAIIAAAIEQLPPKRKQIYIMSRDQGLSRKEIAAALGISESTIKNQLNSALGHIQEYIKNTEGFFLPLFLLLLIK